MFAWLCFAFTRADSSYDSGDRWQDKQYGLFRDMSQQHF